MNMLSQATQITLVFLHGKTLANNRVGWRMGVCSSAICAMLVFLLNLTITIYAIIKWPPEGGFGTIHRCSCKEIKTLSVWIHFGINSLGTILLSSSNYTQQVLMRYVPWRPLVETDAQLTPVSPTRAEIDKAHSAREWLHIGVPNVGNMRWINRKRAILWWCIGLTSIPLHLL